MALDDRYTNKFTPLNSTVIYHKPGHKLLYTPMTGEMKCPRLYLCLAYSIPSPSMLMQHMHQPYHKWYDPLHIITWPYWFIDLDLTCFSPFPSSIGAKSCSSFITTRSIVPKPPTCPPRLQPVHQAKSCLDLLHLSHMTQCHVSCVMSSFIITVWALQYLRAISTSMAYVAHTYVPVD